MQRVVELPGEITSIVADGREEIGAADIADEQRVAGEHTERLAGRAVGPYDDADGFGGVARCLEDLEVDRAEREMIAVAMRLDREADAPGRRLAVDDVGTGGGGEFEMTGEEVGVEVRLDHLRDGEPVGGGIVQVFGDVALGVDHDGGARLGVADEVARVREAVQVVLREEQGHVGSSIGGVGTKGILPHLSPQDTLWGMCRQTTCKSCGKPSWAGCGAHVEQVLGHVPKAERCRCGEGNSVRSSKRTTPKTVASAPAKRRWFGR